MDGYHIRLAQQRFQIHLLIGRVIFPACCGIAQNPAAEGFCDSRHLPANGAQTDDAPGLSFQLEKLLIQTAEHTAAAVSAGFHISIIPVQLFQHIKQQRKGVLCHRVCGIPGHIRHRQIPAAAVIHVHDVRSRGRHTQQLRVGRFFQRAGIHGHLVHQDHVGLRHPLSRLLLRGGIVNHQFSQLLQRRNIDIIP